MGELMDLNLMRVATTSSPFSTTSSPLFTFGSSTTLSMSAPATVSAVFTLTADETIKRINEEFDQLNIQYQAELNFQQQQQQGVMNPFATALARNNFHKNRYSNIMPPENTRVKLLEYRELNLDSDYINANYIDGEIPGSKRAYIACQAPLASTLVHFWLMIWENECAVIVMLTRLYERDRAKATAYWPEEPNTTKQFGPFKVTHTKSKSVNSFLDQRVFDVEFNGQTRNIVQLHYTEWPDFGAPESTQVIRELVALMDVYRMKGKLAGLNGPVVAHCSAGVGRAGTFIAIHICLEKMKYFNALEEIVDIPRTVRMLRQSRTGMVQTVEQYRFIYEVVRDARQDFKNHSPGIFAAAGPFCGPTGAAPGFKRPSTSSKRSRLGGGHEPRSLCNSCAACYTVTSSLPASDSSPFDGSGISDMETVDPDLFVSAASLQKERRKALTVAEKRRLSFSLS